MLGVAARGRLRAREQAFEAPVLPAGILKLVAQLLDLTVQFDDLASGRREVTLRFRCRADGSHPPLEERRQSVTLLLDGSQAPQLS